MKKPTAKKKAAPRAATPPPAPTPEPAPALLPAAEPEPAPAPVLNVNRQRITSLEEFHALFGLDFYVFLHSPCGQGLLEVLDAVSPAKALPAVSPAEVTQFGTAYAANIQGWTSCVETIRTKLVPVDEPGAENAADYQAEQ